MYTPPFTYYSRNRRISPSRSHKDLWIVDSADNKFFPITGTTETINSSHPPDPDQQKAEKQFRFSRNRHAMSAPPTRLIAPPTPKKFSYRKPVRKWSLK